MFAESWDRERAPDEGHDTSQELPNDVEAERQIVGALCSGYVVDGLDALDVLNEHLPTKSGQYFDNEVYGAVYDAALAVAKNGRAVDVEAIRIVLRWRKRSGDFFAAAALKLQLYDFAAHFEYVWTLSGLDERGISFRAVIERAAGSVVRTWALRQQLFDTNELARLYHVGDTISAQAVHERMQERSHAYLGQQRPPIDEMRQEMRKLNDQIAEMRRIRRLPAAVASPTQKLVMMYLKTELVHGDEPRELYDARIGGECGISEDASGKVVTYLADDLGFIAKDKRTKPEYVPDGKGGTALHWRTTRTIAIGEQWEVRETATPRQPRNHGGLRVPTTCPKCGSHHQRLKTYQVCDDCGHQFLDSERFANPAGLDEAMARARMNPSDPQDAGVWKREPNPIHPQDADRLKNSALTDSDPPSNLRTLFGERFTAGPS